MKRGCSKRWLACRPPAPVLNERACDLAANAEGSTVTTATLTSKFSLGHPLMSLIEGWHQAAPEPFEQQVVGRRRAIKHRTSCKVPFWASSPGPLRSRVELGQNPVISGCSSHSIPTSFDGVHPNEKGYAIMGPLVLAVIDKRLGKKSNRWYRLASPLKIAASASASRSSSAKPNVWIGWLRGWRYGLRCY